MIWQFCVKCQPQISSTRPGQKSTLFFPLNCVFNPHIFNSPLLLFKFFPPLSLHTAGAREIWIDQSGFSRWQKIHCPHVNVSWQEWYWNQATFFIGDYIKYSLKGIYNSKTISHCKKWKIWNILFLQASRFCRIPTVFDCRMYCGLSRRIQGSYFFFKPCIRIGASLKREFMSYCFILVYLLLLSCFNFISKLEERWSSINLAAMHTNITLGTNNVTVSIRRNVRIFLS